MMHKTCSINYGHLAALQKTLLTTDLNKKTFIWWNISSRLLFFPFFSICTCNSVKLGTKCLNSLSRADDLFLVSTTRDRLHMCLDKFIPRTPRQPPAILQLARALGTHLTLVGLVMADCCPINHILSNIGRRNSIRILNQHPLFWNILTWTQVFCFIKFFSKKKSTLL